MSLVADALTLARKDLVVEVRARDAIGSAVALSAVALVLVGLAVGPDPSRLRTLAPAVVWIALLYTALVIAERFERIDRSDDAFSGLWLLVEDRRSLYLGRVLSLATALASLELVLWTGAVVLLDIALTPAALLLLPLAVLTAVTAAAGVALVLPLVTDAGQRALLLPVALLPLLVPTFLAGVQGSAAIVEARPGDAAAWVATLVIEAALFLGLGLLTYESAAGPE